MKQTHWDRFDARLNSSTEKEKKEKGVWVGERNYFIIRGVGEKGVRKARPTSTSIH